MVAEAAFVGQVILQEVGQVGARSVMLPSTVLGMGPFRGLEVPVGRRDLSIAEVGGQGQHVTAGVGLGCEVLDGPDGEGVSQRV